jgi:hypothetical protein
MKSKKKYKRKNKEDGKDKVGTEMCQQNFWEIVSICGKK